MWQTNQGGTAKHKLSPLSNQQGGGFFSFCRKIYTKGGGSVWNLT